MTTGPVNGEGVLLDKIDRDEWQLNVLLQKVSDVLRIVNNRRASKKHISPMGLPKLQKTE